MTLGRDDVVALLRSHGRVTGPRVSVVEHLANAPDHRTAVEVHQSLVDKGTTVNLSTVHRTLTSLLDSGIVHVVYGPKGATYGLCDETHAHATCSVCGRTIDHTAGPSPTAVDDASNCSLRLTDVSMCLIGVCQSCRKS